MTKEEVENKLAEEKEFSTTLTMLNNNQAFTIGSLYEQLDSLKKVYNDLAESHAKQVIEIGELQKGAIGYEMALDKLACENEELKNLHNSIENAYLLNEAELLKAKELLKELLHDYVSLDMREKIDEFLNKKP